MSAMRKNPKRKGQVESGVKDQDPLIEISDQQPIGKNYESVSKIKERESLSRVRERESATRAQEVVSKNAVSTSKPATPSSPLLIGTSRTHSRRKREETSEESPLAYAILSKQECEHLIGMTVTEIDRWFQTRFKLQPEMDLQEGILLDYYVGAAVWGQQQGYDPHQLSVFFTMVYTLLSRIKGEDPASLHDLVSELQSMLAGMGTDSTTLKDKVFSTKQAKAIIDYIYTSLLQHYRLYIHVLVGSQDEQIISKQLSVEVPYPIDVPWPKSLDESLPEIMLDFIAQPTLTREMSQLGTGSVIPLSPLPDEIVPELEDVLKKLTLEDVRTVVEQACESVWSQLQNQLQIKLEQEEGTVLKKISNIN